MKQISIVLMFLLSFAGCFFSGNQKQSYTINGTLPDSIDNVYVYLTPISIGNNQINDSAFSFSKANTNNIYFHQVPLSTFVQTAFPKDIFFPQKSCMLWKNKF